MNWAMIGFGLFGAACGVLNFCLEHPVFVSRVWDGLMGAAILGNLAMVAGNAGELLTGEDDRND